MIRGFKREDAAQCAEIINGCVRTMDGLNGAAREFLYAKNVPDRVGEELRGFFSVVYEEAGVIVGLGSLAGHEIRRLYVDPAAQGKTIGSEILSALEEEAARQGSKRLMVRSSPSAVGFYERGGYERAGSGSFWLGQAKFEFVEMVKEMSED